MKKVLCKYLLATFGALLPAKRHPGGKFANKIRCQLAKGIIAEMKEPCVIEPGAEIMEGCIFGDHTNIGSHAMIGAMTKFEGNNMMGPNVHIYTSNHQYNTETHSFEGMVHKPVVIGRDVWIGYGVIILPGVTIGRNTIIGAGSVVTKNIPSGVIAAGNPCVVKKILDQKIYEEDMK